MMTRGIIGTLVYLLIGFLLGSLFNDAISTNLNNTDWMDLMVYIWMVFWPFILCFKLFFWIFFIGACIAIGFAIHDWVKK